MRNRVMAIVLSSLLLSGCDYKPRAGGVENQLLSLIHI